MSKEEAANYLNIIEKRLHNLSILSTPLESPRINYHIESAKRAFNNGNYTDCLDHCKNAESLISDSTRKFEDIVKETLIESGKIEHRRQQILRRKDK